MKTDKFYTVKALADRLAITPMTVYRMAKQGKLPATRIGGSIRFRPEDIEAFLETVRVGPTGLSETKQGEEKHGQRKSK
jgi:excisionase family DNA binding protein